MKPGMIYASALAADFSKLAEEVKRVEPYVDGVHLDVMDGHFVPNLSFGAPVIKSLRSTTDLHFDTQLMMTNPHEFFADFADAGCEAVSVHIETYPDPTEVAASAREHGMTFGLALNPPTPADAVAPYLDLCDHILAMTVNPGFGGQKFIEDVLPKIETLREMVDANDLSADIQVDGGITAATAPLARKAGAEMFVVGTALFRAPDPVGAAQEIREAIS